MTMSPFEMMPDRLSTTRLRLRAPGAADAPRIAMFIGDWDVAKMLAGVPHPYRESDALAWIASRDRKQGIQYALVHANGVIGVVEIAARHENVAELRYWLAKPFWNRGLMTEAARAVVQAWRACSPDLPLACGHFDDNAASRRVVEKLGFVSTGVVMSRSLSRQADVRTETYRLPLAGNPALAQTARRRPHIPEMTGGSHVS